MASYLYLDIEGTLYGVELVDDPGECVRLEHPKSGMIYEIIAEKDGFRRAETTPDGITCTCPNFHYRHAGTGSVGCKHIRACLEARLIVVPVSVWR